MGIKKQELGLKLEVGRAKTSRAKRVVGQELETGARKVTHSIGPINALVFLMSFRVGRIIPGRHGDDKEMRTPVTIPV